VFGTLRQRSDTWELAAVDPARVTAFDAVRSRTVLFGGDWFGTPPRGETWEWDGRDWILRTPALSPPRRADVAPSRAAIVRCGLSDSSTGGLPLPFALGRLGMPGCSLLVSTDLSLPVTGSQAAVQLPHDPGLALYFEAFGIEPGANPLGVATSQGLTARLGLR